MRDNEDSFYDDYVWDVENGFIEEPTGGSSGEFIGLRSVIGGLLLLSFIFTIFNIDVENVPGALLVILVLGSCWVWAKIRGFT